MFKRKAPLINLLAGIAAVGEASVEALIGDMDAAKDSAVAAIYNLSAAIWPYLWWKRGRRVNRSNATLNIVWGGLTSLGNNYSPTRSISRAAYPLIALIATGANGLEAYLKKGEWR